MVSRAQLSRDYRLVISSYGFKAMGLKRREIVKDQRTGEQPKKLWCKGVGKRLN
jgi:hypothetical protein